jgi:signal transduction histidine kinase
MRSLRDFSIRGKLIAIIMLTSSVALLLACAAFIAYDLVAFRRGMVRDLSILTEVIASNCTAPLAFNDQKAAEETMSALRANAHVMTACVLTRTGEVFATYVRGTETPVCPPASELTAGQHFTVNALNLVRPIVLGNDVVGTIQVRADLQELDSRVLHYTSVIGLMALLATAIAYLLSRRLQGVISEPILALESTARTVTAHRDYSLRASPRGNDEIGSLIASFNEMLLQIQRRDDALEKARGELEERVAQRTAQLRDEVVVRRQAEDEIRRLNTNLEQRVLDRTAQLAAANRELESFSYSVSHDLRVPLRAIHGLCRGLLEEHAGHLDPEGQRILNLVRDSAARMSQLIDDLLEFSRLGRVELTVSRFDFAALARQVSAELAALEPGRSLRIEVEDMPPAWGDPTLVRQVLVNLISNAIKFTRGRAPATIRITAAERDGDTVYSIRDNGVGFDMNYAHKLFHVFQRLHGSKAFEGTGVGLAIVQHIVLRHGGRVWAEGHVDEGACFAFTLGRQQA